MVKLTKVELQVLECISAGLSKKQIGPLVHRSEASVGDITKRLRQKFKMHTIAGVVGAAYGNGVLPVKQDA